jgi:hypothetical protein
MRTLRLPLGWADAVRFALGAPPDGGSLRRLSRRVTRPAPASSDWRSIDASPALTSNTTAPRACSPVPSGRRRVNACGSASSTFRKTARPAAASSPARSCEASWASAGIKETARPAANPHVLVRSLCMSSPSRSPRVTHSWRNVQRPRSLSARNRRSAGHRFRHETVILTSVRRARAYRGAHSPCICFP